MKNNRDNIEITELFMAKAGSDFSRCFYGTITRLKDRDDIPYVYGEIRVHDQLICARADNQEELGRKLDILCALLLEHNVHNIPIKTSPIGGYEVYLN